MELRHLDALAAVADSGSFTAAADQLHTVQSNVSQQVRQLELELGVSLFDRGRKGAIVTEFGRVALEGARRVRRELEAMRADLSALLGLEAGHASFGVVGTSSRWLVPKVVADLQARAPGVQLRITEGASERLAFEVASRELAMAVVTEPVVGARLEVQHLMEEELVGLVPKGTPLPPEPVPFEVLAGMPMILPLSGNPFREEVEGAAARLGLTLSVPVEVEGVRLIADLVAEGRGVSVLPRTAVLGRPSRLREVAIEGLPPRRLALVTSRDAYLSLAERAVRDALLRLVAVQRDESAVSPG